MDNLNNEEVPVPVSLETRIVEAIRNLSDREEGLKGATPEDIASYVRRFYYPKVRATSRKLTDFLKTAVEEGVLVERVKNVRGHKSPYYQLSQEAELHPHREYTLEYEEAELPESRVRLDRKSRDELRRLWPGLKLPKNLEYIWT